MNVIYKVLPLLIVLFSFGFSGELSKITESDNAVYGDGRWLKVITPSKNEEIKEKLSIKLDVSPMADSILFVFFQYPPVKDTIAPFEVTYDVSYLSSGNYKTRVLAYWDTVVLKLEVPFIIVTVYGEKGALVLNGDTIPEHKITRNSKDQVIGLYFNDLGLNDPKCLFGLEHNCEVLETLILEYNYLLTIDLSPLKKCRELKYLTIFSNQLEEINLSPLSSCKKLEYLNLMQNHISEIKISALKSCKKLREINLDMNNISTFKIKALKKLDSLEKITLIGNPLNEENCKEICTFIREKPKVEILSRCKCEEETD